MTNDETKSAHPPLDERQKRTAALKKKLNRAAAQAKRGELVDGEQFIARLLAQLGQR